MKFGKHLSVRKHQTDGIQPQELDQPLAKALAPDRPYGELLLHLVIGAHIQAAPRHDLVDPLCNVFVDILLCRHIDEFHRGPGQELHVPDVALPLGDLLEHDGASLLAVLKRRRDRLHLVEALVVSPPVGDIGDHLLLLKILDHRERFCCGDHGERRLLYGQADQLVLCPAEVPEALVVCLDDPLLSIEDQDQVLRETEEGGHGDALSEGVDLCVPDRPDIDPARNLEDLEVLGDRIPGRPDLLCHISDGHALRTEPESTQDSRLGIVLCLHMDQHA
ncbi:hypothetical protein ASZ90_010406 [hydrocarbon metagenome]|uniref:Uncharacterized protein n=1 Tax=hydrocarbon metagenome TaxID=938273 RepID=A0A0W8FGI5_9ZZZZ